MDSVCITASIRYLRRLWWRVRAWASSQLPREGIRDVGMRQRVAVAGGGLVEHPDARMIGLRVGEGMDHIAKREQRPACAGRSHFCLEGIALGLRCDRIGGAVHRKNGGF